MNPNCLRIAFFLTLIAALCCVSSCAAEHDPENKDSTLTIAVASNFMQPMRELAADYEDQTGVRLVLVFGSSGKLYAQIKNGAPFDLFLSADQAKPIVLEQDQLIVAGSRDTYALGRLALWWPEFDSTIGADQMAVLLSEFDATHKLAIAHPLLAPYGAAALEVLNELGVYEELQSRLVRGENISQAYHYVESGNARAGFVALSQIRPKTQNTVTANNDDVWVVPSELHAPIRQEMVLLKRANNNDAAQHFYQWLQSDEIQARIRSFGYGTDAESSPLTHVVL